MNRIDQWYREQGWEPWPFQREAWEAYLKGGSGLISVPTGAGKTYAALFGPLIDCLERPGKGLKVLYLTPLKSLSRDIEKAIRRPIEELGLGLTVEARTGDTTSYRKQKQKKKPPDILLTTPESLALLLSDPQRETLFGDLRGVIIDEWHELMATKRGVLLELCLSALRMFRPDLRTWALSATLGNLEQAAQVAVGMGKTPVMVQAQLSREVVVQGLYPDSFQVLPWVGRFGARMVETLVDTLDPKISTLIFTNTRSQAEGWYDALLEQRPDWKPLIGLHHGSTAYNERLRVEEAAKEGVLPFVVCTSSLDLGIDFARVERVVQIGSPKSIARLVQRAGRASHRPMTSCRIDIIPTHAWEVVEIEAIKKALAKGNLEKREPLALSLDVLFQHLTTLAVGGGFEKEEVFQALLQTHAFHELRQEVYEDILEHLTLGGKALQAYPDYHKLANQGGRYVLRNPRQAPFHRMQIGVIQDNPQITVKTLRGKPLGTVDERFIATLPKGAAFAFGGKTYTVSRFKDLVLLVKASKAKEAVRPVWKGASLPLSPSVSDAVRAELKSPSPHQLEQHILDRQAGLSYLPDENELLVEQAKTREGWHLFFYPFEGKAVHEAVAALTAYRLSQQSSVSLSTSATDYGFEILSSKDLELTPEQVHVLFTEEGLEEDLHASLNLSALAKVRFREIAQIGGLVFGGYPGKKKSVRQVTLSTSLLFDVFEKFEPEHLLYRQAFIELFEREFDLERIRMLLRRVGKQVIKMVRLDKLSPLALPIFSELISARITSEKMKERIERIQRSWK